MSNAVISRIRGPHAAGLVLLLTLRALPVAADPATPVDRQQTATDNDTRAFVPVALDQRETVSGEVLMFSAYAVILGLLLLYVYMLYRRQKAVERAAAALGHRLKRDAP